MFVHARYYVMLAELQYALSITEEIFRFTRSQWIEVIIKIQIFLIQTFNHMKVHLDRITVECREIFLGDDILMKNDLQTILVYPFRNLRRMGHNQIYIPDERHVNLNSAQKIFQCSPIAETLLHYRNIGIFLVIRFPYRIVSVNICNYNIHKFYSLARISSRYKFV